MKNLFLLVIIPCVFPVVYFGYAVLMTAIRYL